MMFSNFSKMFVIDEVMYLYLRAIARSREIAGDPGGVSVRILESSLRAVCLTVIVCLKSNGNDICPGSRFNS